MKKLQSAKLAEIFHVPAVNQAGLGLASETARVSNLVPSARKEQDKAALCPFRRLLDVRMIHVSTDPGSR